MTRKNGCMRKLKLFLSIAVITGLLVVSSVIAYKKTLIAQKSVDSGLACLSDTLSAGRRFWASTKGAIADKPSSATSELSGQMVWIHGGDFWMGDANPDSVDAHPVHKVHVDGFWMDQYPVTNEEYAEFVAATGYVTVAERILNPEEYPNVPAEMLEPGSVIFDPPKSIEHSNGHIWWHWQKGANWKHPDGPQSDLRGREKFPVVQIAYEDAEAYAQWKGKRLPTEAEWEYAARGGLDRKTYSWGDELHPQGKFMANFWQGDFPLRNLSEDGFQGPSPVGSFPANAFGLYDMTGNVWQWTSDWYRPDYYKTLSKMTVVKNPQGPEAALDPEEPRVRKRVQKGGSYLCSEEYCGGLRPGFRGKGDIMGGSPQVGFRLVQDDKMSTTVSNE